MAQNIILKRSSLSGKVPTTSSLNLGEIAINTYDGRAFIHKSGSTESVEHIVVTNSITTGSINITQTGSFGELVVTNDLNVGDSIYVTNDIVVGGDVDAVGAVTASFFVGDGSLLTGISAGATDNEIPSNDWDYNLPDSGTLSDGNNQSTKYTVDFQAEALMGRPVGYQTFITNDAGTTEIIPGRDEIKFIVNNIEVGKVDAGGIVGTTPMGTISSSAQITALGFVSSSISNIDTASLSTTGSNIFIGNQTITGSAYISGSLYAANLIAGNSSSNFNSITVVTSDINFTSSLYSTIGIDVDTGGEHSAGISVSTYTQFGQTPATILYGGGSGSNATGANDSIYFQNGKIDIVKNTTISGSLNVTGSITGSTNFNTIVNKPTLISGSSQLTSSFETVGRGIISSSAQLPSGLISGSSQLPTGLVSGSSQLTSSYDTRYTLSGSVQPLPSGVISGSSQLTSSYDLRYEGVGRGIISGSSQLTSSYDTRYLVTGSVTSSILQLNTFTASNANTSLNTTTASLLIETANLEAFSASVLTRLTTIGIYTSSLNVWTSSVATTGSNAFNGNQTITGSLTVSSFASFSASFIANSSSLTLNSGSNLYIQNNGLAEITGSLIQSGSLTSYGPNLLVGNSTITGSISISSGSITMVNRPAFRVIGNASTDRTTPVTLSGSAVTVDYNEGGYFNTTNGLFTAPIAGLYQIYYNGRAGSANAAMQVIVYKNGATPQLMWEAAGNTGATHFGVSGIVKLAVNDTLRATVTVGSIQFDANDSFGATYIG